MPKISTPVAIPAYSSDTEDVYIFSLSLVFDGCVLDPTSDLDYDLQIDSLTSFGSPNLITLHKASGAPLVNFQEGNTTKVFEVRLPRRIRDEEMTWYWRARVKKGLFITDYTDTQTLVVPPQLTHALATEAHDSLADENFYPKESNSTYIFRLFNAGANELDALQLETRRVKEDTFLDYVRDSSLNNNFGSLYQHDKAVSETFGDYRNRIRILRTSFLDLPATEQGIKNVVESFVVQPPVLTDNSDTEGWILDTNYLYDPAHTSLTPYAVLYSRANRGFGFTLRIFNSWDIDFDQTVLETLVKRIMPRHARADFQYPTQKPSEYCINIAADWNSGTFSNTSVVGDYLTLGTSPSVDFEYTGDALPESSSPSWEAIGAPDSASVSSGVLSLTGTTIMYQASTTPSWYYTATQSAAVLKTRMQVISAPSYVSSAPYVPMSYQIVATIPDQVLGTTVTAGIRFYSDAVFLEGGGVYLMDTTSAFHDYTFIFKNSGYVLYVDGTLVKTFPKAYWATGQATVVQFGMDGVMDPVSVKIDSIQVYDGNVGTWLSPVVDGKTLNAWSYLIANTLFSAGDSLTLQLRSSLNSGGPFSSWETVTNNSLPSSTPAREYFQLLLTLTSASFTTGTMPQVTDVTLNYERG